MPKEGEDTLSSYPAIQELCELLKQGAHVVVSMPEAGQLKVVSISYDLELAKYVIEREA